MFLVVHPGKTNISFPSNDANMLSLRQISKAEEEIPTGVTTNHPFGLVSSSTKPEKALSTKSQPRGLDELGFKAWYKYRGLIWLNWVVE